MARQVGITRRTKSACRKGTQARPLAVSLARNGQRSLGISETRRGPGPAGSLRVIDWRIRAIASEGDTAGPDGPDWIEAGAHQKEQHRQPRDHPFRLGLIENTRIEEPGKTTLVLRAEFKVHEGTLSSFSPDGG